jgi:endonuclease YncB( thermonuclease family)
MRSCVAVIACLLVTGSVVLAEEIRKEDITVIDGDTIRLRGNSTSIRLRNHNAPETYKAKCEQERALGEKSRARLQEMVNTGKVDLGPVKAHDVYRREVREMTVNGVDVGKTLRSEGLAKRQSREWCR